MTKKIFIVGSGSIGKALAVFLKHENRNVIILRGSVDDQSMHTERIQVILNDKTKIEAEVEINTISNFVELDGIIVLTNKSYGNQNVAQLLRGKVGNSPLVILQNGLGIEQTFVDADFTEIYRCVLFVTCQNISNTTLSFKPVSISPIGIIKGMDDNLNTIVRQLNSSFFPFKSETDIQKIIWKKAIVNSVFNSICPLVEMDNGIFHREAAALEIAKRIIAECVSICNEKGVSLSVEEVEESLLLISKLSDGQLISTLQDIRKGRRTEIETLNFAIVAIAKKLNRESAVTETRLLGELTKLKSELSVQ